MIRYAGFTLIETVVVIVVLAVGVTGFLLFLNQTTAKSADPMIQVQANAIAQSYLDEVLLRPFCDPDLSTDCPNTCSVVDVCTNVLCSSLGEASRDVNDEICDYDGLADTGAEDQSGNPIAVLSSYNVSVTVVDDASVALNTLVPGEVMRVDVTVTHSGNSNVSVTLSGYKANY